MLIARIEGATTVLGAPAGWDAEAQGQCAGLPVLRTLDGHGHPCMQSAWQPTPDELAALNAGASVILTVFGQAHPPVWIAVSEPPK